MLRFLLIFAYASLGFTQMSCGPNEVFDTCGSACEPSCRNPNPTICTLQCVVGCRCRQGFFRDDFGQCVASCGPPGLPMQSAPSPWAAPPQPGPSPSLQVPTPTSCLGAICPSGRQCVMVAEPCPFIACALPTPKCVPLSSQAAPSQPLPAPIPTSCFEAQCIPGTVCEMVIEPCFFIYCAVPRPMCVSSAQSRSPRSSNRGPSPPVQTGPTSPPSGLSPPSKPSPVPNPPSPSRPSPVPASAPAPKPTPVQRPPPTPRPSPTPAPAPAPKPTPAIKPPSPPRPSPTSAPPPPFKPLPVPKPPSSPQPSAPSPPGHSQQLRCPQNESWSKCPTQCEPTCSNMNPKCNKACGEPKCQCDEGFFRNRSGSCVRSSECPRRDSRESREINSRESQERRRG